jgi:hypothetical protein
MIDVPARAADPQPLPAGISRGLDGRYYQDVCDHSYLRPCLSRRRLPESFVPDLTPTGRNPRPLAGGYCAAQGGGGGSSTPVPYTTTPNDVQEAYAIPQATGAFGKIVAVVDMPDSHAYADLNAYRAGFNMPALPQCPNGLPDGKTACFAQVDETGHPSSTGDCASSDIETSIDIDMVTAACPDCSILVVQMTDADPNQGPTDGDFVQSTQTAAQLGAVASSISFGGGEYPGEPTGFTTPGHLVFAASGDSGYLLIQSPGGGHSPGYPASAPDVLGVGGTTLVALGGGTYGEKVWDDSSFGGGTTTSGCSTEFPIPAFQTAFLATHAGAFGSCTKRDSVDLAAAAEFVSGQGGGIAFYDAVDKWSVGTGTSAASPMVAAIFTRLGVADATSSNLGFPYVNIAAFNDITNGTDAVGNSCTDNSCVAGVGWDGPTGVGTPNGGKLALLGTPNMPSGSSSGGPDGGADSGSASDSGSGADSGGVVVDSGTGSSSGGDAGSGSGDNTTAKSGCGCTTVGSARSTFDALGLLAMGAGALVIVRRRRSRG